MTTHAPLTLDCLWLPLITPLRDGHVDTKALENLAHYYKLSGISGLVLFGSTGEGNLLSMRERFDAFHALRNAVPDLPLMIGVGGVDTRNVYQSIKKLEELQPDGWLVPPPYYLRPAAEGILWHYQQVAWATNRPVVIYNVPQRTGVALTAELMEVLCENSNCIAVKECNSAVLSSINLQKKLTALCGEDTMFLNHFLQKGAGAIAASAHIRPDAFVAVMKLAKENQDDAAREIFRSLQPVIHLLYSEPNPAPIKKALSMMGYIADELRLPMTSASDNLGRQLLEAIEAIPSLADIQNIAQRHAHP